MKKKRWLFLGSTGVALGFAILVIMTHPKANFKAQTPAVSCPAGQAVISQLGNTGQGCGVFATAPLAATTPSIGGSLVSVGCANQTAVTVTGATTGMTCSMSGTAGNPANIQPQCSVSAANTVIPQLCTAIALGVTPTAQTYNIRVIP